MGSEISESLVACRSGPFRAVLDAPVSLKVSRMIPEHSGTLVPDHSGPGPARFFFLPRTYTIDIQVCAAAQWDSGPPRGIIEYLNISKNFFEVIFEVV